MDDTTFDHTILFLLVFLFVSFFAYRLCRVQRRIQKGFDVFEYYANNQWDFDNSNVLYMRTIINKTEAVRYAIEDKRELNHLSDSILLVTHSTFNWKSVVRVFLFVLFLFTEIDMYEYFEHCIHAARLYILKESDDTIPAARRHMKV